MTCFLPRECENIYQVYTYYIPLVLVPTRTAAQLLLRYGASTGKIKSNPLESHFGKSATMSRSLEGTKPAVAMPHCSGSTYDSIAGWCIFGSEVWLELWQNDVMSYMKNTQVEVVPVADLFKESAKYHFFCGRYKTGES